MNDESINSSFVTNDAHTSDNCYDGDINNSSTDYNITMEEEIRQTSTLCREFVEAAARGTKRIASFYPTRFVIDFFSLIEQTLSLVCVDKRY